MSGWTSGVKNSFRFFFLEGGWAREICSICQLLVFLRGNCAVFGPQKGHSRRFRTTSSMNVTQILYVKASLFL